MATPRWIAAALDVADVWRLVIGGTWAANDTITLTVGTRDLTLTVGATTTTTAIATALKEMWNGEDATGDATRTDTGDNVPEFAEAEASVASSTVTFTHQTAGVPITISRTLSSATGTATLTNPTVATGKNFWNNADNWDTGANPANGDTVYIDNSDVDILYGLAQSGVTLAALYVAQSFTGSIGLPEYNEDGDYHEYRSTYLAIGATLLQVGAGPGDGSGRVRINTGSVQTALTVFNSGSPLDDVPAIVWKGTHASNALVQTGGSLGVAVYGAETATLATITKSGGSLYCGTGTTLSGALAQNGGDAEFNSAIAGSLTQTAGATVINGTGAVAQLTVRGGGCVYNTTGTLGGNTVVSGDGFLDFTQNSVAKTVTNPIDLHGRDCVVDDTNKVLGAVVADFNEGADPSQFRFGPHSRLSRGSVA